jgi:hypothetical protein
VSVSGEHGVSHSLYIGASGTGNYFNGLIDDVQVYNYACPPDEVGRLIYEATSKQFWVKDASGSPVACIDNLGNLYLKGTLTESGTPQASSENDEFRVQNSSSVDVAIINATTGNMAIAQTKHQGLPDPTDFIVENSENDVVAYIDTSGNLYLGGKVYSNWVF